MTLKMLETILTIAAVVIVIYVLIKKNIGTASATSSSKAAQDKGKDVEDVEDIESANVIGKKKIKLIPYKEALEASRQFIYSIAKIVLEKFSPQSKETLMQLGGRLFKAGVQYVHVVDIFSLSLEKQRRKAIDMKKKNLEKGRQA